MDAVHPDIVLAQFGREGLGHAADNELARRVRHHERCTLEARRRADQDDRPAARLTRCGAPGHHRVPGAGDVRADRVLVDLRGHLIPRLRHTDPGIGHDHVQLAAAAGPRRPRSRAVCPGHVRPRCGDHPAAGLLDQAHRLRQVLRRRRVVGNRGQRRTRPPRSRRRPPRPGAASARPFAPAPPRLSARPCLPPDRSSASPLSSFFGPDYGRRRRRPD